MQLELTLSDSPAAVLVLWEQLDPIARQAAIDRLALAIAKAALPPGARLPNREILWATRKIRRIANHSSDTCFRYCICCTYDIPSEPE